jgi:hypothetical protein
VSEKDTKATSAKDASAPPPEFWANLIAELKAGRDIASQAEVLARLQAPGTVPSHERNYQNPRGKDYPMPALKAQIWAPHVIHPAYHGLDREEVELFNLVVDGAIAREGKTGYFTYTKTDGEEEPMTVESVINETTGKVEKIRLTCRQFEKEFKAQRFPGMRACLREILEQHDGDIAERTRRVMTMKRERQLIENGELSVTK